MRFVETTGSLKSTRDAFGITNRGLTAQDRKGHNWLPVTVGNSVRTHTSKTLSWVDIDQAAYL
jgi:hypothetical protein